VAAWNILRAAGNNSLMAKFEKIYYWGVFTLISLVLYEVNELESKYRKAGMEV